MTRFPAPLQLGPSSTRWRLSDLEAYEAHCSGDPCPPRRSSEDERYFDVKQVAARYSSSPATVWRWVRNGRDQEAA